MTLIHIIGFGPRPKISMKYRSKWYSRFPDEPLKIDKGDVAIINLNEVHDAKMVDQIRSIVTHIEKHGGLLVVISAPLRYLTNSITNYHFLPWHNQLISEIQNFNFGLYIQPAEAVPSGVRDLLHGFSEIMMAPVCFPRIPSDAHSLMKCSVCDCVSFNDKHIRGRILVIPPLRSVLHGESDSSAKLESAEYLEHLTNTVLVHFWESSESEPDWLLSIKIRNEDELRDKYQTLKNELGEINEEKRILADDGYTLTQKVANILQALGFQTEEKEVYGKQDIEIMEGKFKALIECTGGSGYFNIDKLRQLIDYLITDDEEKPKGIFIGNPWKNIHPKKRDLSKAFTENVVKRATQLEICLVTVPHLYRAYLACKTDENKEKLRESLKNCVGIWQYPVNEWE